MRNYVLLSTRGEFYHTLKGTVKGNSKCEKNKDSVAKIMIYTLLGLKISECVKNFQCYRFNGSNIKNYRIRRFKVSLNIF